MSTMLRELRALEAGVGAPAAGGAGARPGSAPGAGAGGNQAVLLRSLDETTAIRAVTRAGSRDGIARATSRETLLRDLERDLGIAAHPRMDQGAPAALAALGGSLSSLQRPGSAGGSALPPPVRPGGDDGAAALARASALLADMSSAAPSRLERQNSRGDLSSSSRR